MTWTGSWACRGGYRALAASVILQAVYDLRRRTTRITDSDRYSAKTFLTSRWARFLCDNLGVSQEEIITKMGLHEVQETRL